MQWVHLKLFSAGGHIADCLPSALPAPSCLPDFIDLCSSATMSSTSVLLWPDCDNQAVLLCIHVVAFSWMTHFKCFVVHQMWMFIVNTEFWKLLFLFLPTSWLSLQNLQHPHTLFWPFKHYHFFTLNKKQKHTAVFTASQTRPDPSVFCSLPLPTSVLGVRSEENID